MLTPTISPTRQHIRQQMRPFPVTMSAAALIALTTAAGPRGAHAWANASGVFGRSLSHLVGGGSKTCNNPNPKDGKPALDTSRTGVKRGLFSKLFGGMSEGIDYSTLKGTWVGGWWIDVAGWVGSKATRSTNANTSIISQAWRPRRRPTTRSRGR